ncbi:MAG: AAA family ATPase [Lachnospiraceae bacterium]|jgi:predicted AAA+ superfamily ATPase|nr:AAA family ATPase [Lachnospiraceae bacterium]MDD4524889.1 AAA family ATPase [Lachnospiraceae bacterium]
MRRSIYNSLVKWKNSNNRKPLVLEGARQVGKTWILKEFGNHEFSNMAYLSCDNNPALRDLFIDYDVQRIIRVISALTNERIVPEKTLIVLDEIQEQVRTGLSQTAR